jgi:hypothetical protein
MSLTLGENPFEKGFSPKTPATGAPCFLKLLKVLRKWLDLMTLPVKGEECSGCSLTKLWNI